MKDSMLTSNHNPPMQTRILKSDYDSLKLAAESLKWGDLVAIPTETVYGLAGNALDPEPISKIFEVKNRPHFDPLIVHVALEKSSLASLMQWNLIDHTRMSDEAIKTTDQLIRNFWPGPLTLVLPKSHVVPDLVTSGLSSIAIRSPAHPIAQQILKLAEVPLAAPSANRFGRISPTQASHVDTELHGKIPFIVDGGTCDIGVESTVIHVHENGQLTLLRPGGLPVEVIEQTLKIKVQHSPSHSTSLDLSKTSPGHLESHYAPRKPLYRLSQRILTATTQESLGCSPHGHHALGFLAIDGQAELLKAHLQKLLPSYTLVVEVLSETTQWREAAQTLFEKMRKLDDSIAIELFVEPFLDEWKSGLALAIADRLKRACQNF
jgi:L-threonylcarbamoyladenylate synthase